MPEYLAPGVYVEETSFRPKTIEGVSTSTAGFVGPTRFGPTAGEPELLTSFADFERIYGGLDPLSFDGSTTPTMNYLAHGVRTFFEEGGRRCYVARVYGGAADTGQSEFVGSQPGGIRIVARYPGQAGDVRVTLIARLSDNVLTLDPELEDTGEDQPILRRVQERDTVVVSDRSSTPTPTFHNVVRNDTDPEGDRLMLAAEDGTQRRLTMVDLDPAEWQVRVLTVDVAIERPIIRPQRPSERFSAAEVFEGFSLHPDNRTSLAGYFAEEAGSRRIALTVPIYMVAAGGALATGAAWAAAVFGSEADDGQKVVYPLDSGSDGPRPSAAAYRGPASATDRGKSGFYALEEIEDISIVAAPGYSHNYTGTNESRVRTIQQHLINHCERMRYRIAVLDAPDNQVVSEVREFRGQLDTKYAALYYPWVTILDPIAQAEANLPPSGFVAGIYARNDTEFGVQKAPANEVVRLAVRFETAINKGQQDVLNPEGINCFRFFEGRGYRLWARTATSDGEWKYVNLRRYFAYLERSIDKGTQIFVFESNGERLWENVRRTVSDFLFNEWKSGRLMGLTPEEAFFVRCDRTTMTQNDIDNGRLICEIGVAPLRPAEFVIFRIGQKLLETTA